jgi:ankyrin repeat protein
MCAARPSRVSPRRLPEQPNLEQLRKQAKDLLKNFRSGDPEATAEVGRFERNPQREGFTLTDAQRVLARAYGFQSWPKLKAFVDGVTIERFAEAVKRGDLAQTRGMLADRPELALMDRSEGDEHRAIHYAVLRRDPVMVRLLMEAGADARKGIWPHRDATTALGLAQARGFDEVVAIIEEEEARRREEMSCPNATVSPVQDQISAAIRQGDRSTALRLLQADLSLLHACDRNGRTPLHIAAGCCDVALVEWLVQRRSNINKKDTEGLTALDHAALGVNPRNDRRERFPGIAQLLLERGAEVTARAAVALGDEDRLREAIRAEPELLRQISSDGGLLTLAVKHGQIAMVRVLLELGADVDERILLEQVEEPTASWGMPLWYAALAGDAPISRELLDRGADPNANVYASGWPLGNAWNHADDSVKKLLLERGATVQPYMIAGMHDVETARRMLANDPGEELAQELGWSAADHGCPEIVELALPHLRWPGNDKRWHWMLIQPIRGAGPDSAQNEGYFRCMDVLLKHGLDPNISRFGATLLHFTAGRHAGISGEDRARFASMLIDHGARLDARDDLLKSTPLGWACRWGHLEMVELLIRRGARVREHDAEPWATPMAWARRMHHDEIVKLLEASSTS